MLPFTADDLKAIQTETFIEHLDYFESLASTNSWALHTHCSPKKTTPVRGVNLPVLVLTGKQTAGRGRGNHSWWSPEGTLTFSLVVDVAQIQIPIEQQPLIALATGLAVCETLEKHLPENKLQLKWPNDVFLQNKKVSGILVETAASVPGLVVIGLGLNLNNSFLSAVEDLKQTGTSLYETTGQKFSMTTTLIDLINGIENRLYDVAGEQNQFMETWRKYCLLSGKTIRVNTGRETKTGQCLEIDDHGFLILKTEAGIERIISGTIEHF
ncbi:MAG: biotin--[acetyl-CoA-carboxylase] ligase [Planctomycetes bacterium]|nr:biotin--[acetyl-CoA-carboxylase] ligase [Planctomycetota bacterium]MCH9727524.1 biotin--[acetyl-CoA-carboxylase] ligase [Planctomycetota bacterium]MCH9777494.1 biotin--[acetyl-CoA-carboxylase] ligase [Planctomycetota bacterium]MCH9792133.1 biotin--[acetyl-CoA-carboxylase] ligase [Planctomycetota bacterium]